MNLQNLVGENQYQSKLEQQTQTFEVNGTTYTLASNEGAPYVTSTPENSSFGGAGGGVTAGEGQGGYDNWPPKFFEDGPINWPVTLIMATLMAYLLKKLWNRLIPKQTVFDARDKLNTKNSDYQLDFDKIKNPWDDHKPIYDGGKEDGQL